MKFLKLKACRLCGILFDHPWPNIAPVCPRCWSEREGREGLAWENEGEPDGE